MARMNFKASFFVALAAALVVGGWAVVQTTTHQQRLAAEADRADDAEDDAEDAQDEIEDLEDRVAQLQREVRRLRRVQEEARQSLSLEDALASGTAKPTAGLSAAVSRFNCIDRVCSAIEGTATFKNDTQEASAITCMFRLEFEDGTETHFSWYAEYVPPKGESSVDLYYAGNHPSAPDFWYDSDDCYRGVATFNPGSGDI